MQWSAPRKGVPIRPEIHNKWVQNSCSIYISAGRLANRYKTSRKSRKKRRFLLQIAMIWFGPLSCLWLTTCPLSYSHSVRIISPHIIQPKQKLWPRYFQWRYLDLGEVKKMAFLSLYQLNDRAKQIRNVSASFLRNTQPLEDSRIGDTALLRQYRVLWEWQARQPPMTRHGAAAVRSSTWFSPTSLPQVWGCYTSSKWDLL